MEIGSGVIKVLMTQCSTQDDQIKSVYLVNKGLFLHTILASLGYKMNRSRGYRILVTEIGEGRNFIDTTFFW